MTAIPTVSFQILGPNEGAADGAPNGIWFKVRSEPAPTEDLVVRLNVRAPDGEAIRRGLILILKHETHSADLFYQTKSGNREARLEIAPFESLSELEYPAEANEGYLIEAGRDFLQYRLGGLSRINPYDASGGGRCIWTDEKSANKEL